MNRYESAVHMVFKRHFHEMEMAFSVDKSGVYISRKRHFHKLFAECSVVAGNALDVVFQNLVGRLRHGTVVVTLSLLLDGDDAMTVAQVLWAL